jgi:hypothetical protein
MSVRAKTNLLNGNIWSAPFFREWYTHSGSFNKVMGGTSTVAVVLLLIIGLSAPVCAQNSAVYYGANGSLTTSGVGPATNGTSVPAACVIPGAYSLQSASSAAALEAADLYSLEATVLAKTSSCVSAINAAVQAFASSCQGQVTVKTQPFGPWQDDSSEEAIEFYYANSYSTTAFCTGNSGYTQAMGGSVGGAVYGFHCSTIAPYAYIWLEGSQFATNCGNVPPSLTVALFDPIADGLASGAGLVSNAAQLAAASHSVVGASADSATLVLVQVIGPSVGDQIQLTLSDESGPSANGASAGYLTALPDNGMDSRTSGGVITVTAVATGGSKTMAFAVYHSPTDFARTGNVNDPTDSVRSVTIGAKDTTAGTSTTQTVNIVRPPVVFIHGLWGSPSDFMSSDGGVLGAFTGQVPWKISFARFDQSVQATSTNPNYVNPQTGFVTIPGNTLGFLYGATQVLPQVRAAVADYKYSSVAGGQIASTQVDIVAHSMGGDITRTLPLLSGYAGQDTYTQGYVHKLITLDTPHLGTPVAVDALSAANGCVQVLLANKSKFIIGTAVVNNASVNGAVGDLQQGSQAITNLKNLPTAMIGGQMTTSQLAGAGQSSAGPIITFICGSIANDPLANALNPKGWSNEMKGDYGDAIVPLNSQFAGNLAYSITTTGASQNTFPAIHSQGIATLGFLPPTVLDQASGAPTQVVNLLNTPVTNSAVFLGSP